MSALADIREVPLDQLVFDDGVQCRVEKHHELTVEHYAELIRDGVAFPPLKAVESVDGSIIVYDGFQRGEGHRRVGSATVRVEVVGTGEVDDARWLATSANGEHGLPLTREDRRSMCRVVLLHPEGAGLSDRSIARRIGTTHNTVASVRAKLEATGEITQLTHRRGADGKLRPASSKRSTDPAPQTSSDDPEPQLPLNPEPQLPFDLAPHAESPEEPDDAPVSPAPRDAATTPRAEASGAHAPACAVCGAEPCACSRVATPEGEPDPDVPPEIEDDAPPWEGGAADTEVPISTAVDPDVPAALTDETQRRAWATLTREVGPLLDAVDEHKRGFRALIERPLGSTRDAILPDTAVADLAAARRLFPRIGTDAQGVIDSLTKLRHAVAHLVPHEVCRHCNGARCGHCQRRGFIFAAEASQREPVR